MSAFKEDFLLGLSYNKTIDAQLGLSIKTSIWIRPFLKNVLHQEDPETYYIFRENRTQLVVGIEEMFPLNNVISFHSSLSISPTLFFYMGSNRDYAYLVAPVVDTGFSFKMGNSADLKSKLRIYIGYRFSREKINRHGFYLMLRMPL